MKICSFQDVRLGEGRVRAFTLIEIKKLFSVIFYKWETVDQIRFHTHAFPAIAFLLWGRYDEERIVNGKIEDNIVKRKFVPRFLPRNYCHAIKKSYGLTLTCVLAGRWQETWWEYFPARDSSPGYWQQYGWGRKKIQKIEGPASMLLDLED